MLKKLAFWKAKKSNLLAASFLYGGLLLVLATSVYTQKIGLPALDKLKGKIIQREDFDQFDENIIDPVAKSTQRNIGVPIIVEVWAFGFCLVFFINFVERWTFAIISLLVLYSTLIPLAIWRHALFFINQAIFPFGDW